MVGSARHLALHAELAPLEAPEIPELDWKLELLPYQWEGVRALLALPSLLLADDMGLGKTIQAISALRILVRTEEVRRVLIVAPASLLKQWQSELVRWAPELSCVLVRGRPVDRAAQWRADATVKIVGYETVRNDAAAGQRHPVRETEWDVVILDEASRIKNSPTSTHRSVMKLSARRRWALTGTPLENTTKDVVSILSFLAGRRPVRSDGSVQELRTVLRTVQVRRRKQDVLPELPEKRVIDVPLEMSPGQRLAYLRAEREGVRRLSAMGPDVPIICVLELIIRLKQLCNRDPVSGESPKLADVRSRIQQLAAEGHKALVFSQFTDSDFGVARLMSELSAFHPVSLTGSMRIEERAEAVAAFQTDPRSLAMVLSLKAGGVGLNLQEASYVFHLDRWWNPAIEDQAEARAHRLGQLRPVTAFRYTMLGSIEERIHEILESKRRLFSEVVEDVSLDLGQHLTREELLHVVGL